MAVFNVIEWDNEWILSRWKDRMNWNKLCIEYNEAHGTSIKYNTFKSHCNREMALNYHYSEEQKAWLRENYPSLGRIKGAKLFNEVFNENKSPEAVRLASEKLGLRVSADRKKVIPIENTGRFHAIGVVVPKTHGEPYVKTAEGWVRLKDLSYGSKPKGHVIVHLDGNVKNFNKENLDAVPRSVTARMTKNRFWSSEPEITRTGIACCKLEEILNDSIED